MDKNLRRLAFLIVSFFFYNGEGSVCAQAIGGIMAEEIVRTQLEAYNNRDIEGCLKYFAEDLKVIILPDENILANSKEEIRAHMKKGMEDGTFQEAKLIDIKANGPYVTTIEEKNDGKVKSTITILYYLEDGLIKKMWGAAHRVDI